MSRPTYIYVDPTALLHNVRRVRECAPGRKIIAMVKANAYGCGVSSVIPVLEGHVDAFGVACIEEALTLRSLGSRSDCVLFQGVFSPDEYRFVASNSFHCVIHQKNQLQWLLDTPLDKKIKVWVKVNTGMHRLGFDPKAVYDVMNALKACPWVDDDIGLMTHLASADEPEKPYNQAQLQAFQQIDLSVSRSIANSAAIMALPASHADVVRPGIMLYGVSPFAHKTGVELGLRPVMNLLSVVTTIRHYPPNSPVGYGSSWQSDKPSIIGVVPVGYGDGYPRHVSPETPTWINGILAPIVGRISMDMLTIDLTHCPSVKEGDCVELWGQHLPVETIAKSAGTIAYELICQVSPRVQNQRK